jgi:nitrogen regulatory protein P-II 1
MKEIKAYIRHNKADLVIEKLEEAGVKGMTLLDANALAEWADSEAFSFSIEYVQKYSKVVKIELICNNEDSDRLIDIISKFAHTGKSGDGWIFITPVEKAVRIKTGEVNDFQNL